MNEKPGIDVGIKRCDKRVRLMGEGNIHCLLVAGHTGMHFAWLKGDQAFQWDDELARNAGIEVTG